ncbi:MAG: malto-oligosyltrehalose synthase [Bacillota bacterium]
MRSVRPRIPTATYRLQFNPQFRFADAAAVVPYLDALGITDLYASPIFAARAGSPHGYDVTDPTRLNPELGGEEGFAALARALQDRGMGLILDVVPNHMAAAADNPWWRDVLRRGPDAAHARYFDIDWTTGGPGPAGKVLLPVLGAPYGRALENGELTLAVSEDGLWVRYHEHRFPLNPISCARVLGWRPEGAAAPGPAHPAPGELAEAAAQLAALPAGAGEDTFRRAWGKIWELYRTRPEIKNFVDENLRLFNGRKDDPESFDALHTLLEAQAYRLALWRTAGWKINYRRFFDIGDFVCLRAEDEEVFAATHALVLRLAREGWITGLRIDHLDGLRDPAGYLDRLQQALGGGSSGFYIVAEKILAEDEELPAGWPVHGTTGYDFLNTVNLLFVDGRGAAALDGVYTRFTGERADFAAVVHAQKRRVMRELFPGEVANLVRQLARLAEDDRHARDLTCPELEEALVEVTASLPVYRTYTRDFAMAARDRAYVESALAAAARYDPALEPALSFLGRVLLLNFPAYLPAERRRAWLDFVLRWQQLTGPIMAKGFEDTALYVYSRLLSLNEVGGNPAATGISAADFHRRSLIRGARWPHSLNATSTHDTKRSEDVRARINVLSEIPAAWAARLARWRAWNEGKKAAVHGRPVPDGNTELLLYQTLLGAWPLAEEEIPAFRERLERYLVKATREAKVHTSWLKPDPAYEEALLAFARRILEPGGGNPFPEDFLAFQKVVAYYGALGSLAQTLLKIASPGVPDFYQGTELWNFSLVDPDNRRHVDFKRRAALLAALRAREGAGRAALAGELVRTWADGQIKLYTVYRALSFRRERCELFAAGEYLPLEAMGPRREYVVAFARRLDGEWVLAAVPRLAARLQVENAGQDKDHLPPLRPPLGAEAWGATSLVLPAAAPAHWENVFTEEKITAPASLFGRATGAQTGVKLLPLASIFRTFPVALLAGCI